MIFEPNEKDLLLRLITSEMSRLSIQGEDKEKVDKVIEQYDVIKKKIKKL